MAVCVRWWHGGRRHDGYSFRGFKQSSGNNADIRIIKILATTLGETGGDTVTMTLNWGYLTGTAIFLSLLVVLVVAQTVAKKFHPLLYWATIVASTTAGTTMADFADRSLGIGYTGGSSILLGCVLAILALWYWTMGSISVETVNNPKTEAFYWAAITFSQNLGTALGDWMADSTGLGYEGGALVFAAGLAVLAAAYSGPTHRVFCCFGRHSFTRRSARRSVTSSINRSAMAASR